MGKVPWSIFRDGATGSKILRLSAERGLHPPSLEIDSDHLALIDIPSNAAEKVENLDLPTIF